MAIGGGIDAFLSAKRVGPQGSVIGVDMTPAMLRRARKAAKKGGYANVTFRHGYAEKLPVEDGAVDVVISNGVFNLCLDKPKVLGELFRVLKPGGRVQMADILLEDGVTPEEVARKGAWSD